MTYWPWLVGAQLSGVDGAIARSSIAEGRVGVGGVAKAWDWDGPG